MSLGLETYALPSKDPERPIFDLNELPPQSPSNKVPASEESLDSMLKSAQSSASVPVESQSTQLASNRGDTTRPKRDYRPRNPQLGHYRNYEHHKAVALRLRDKAPRTMSEQDRKDLKKARDYLRHVIRYMEVKSRTPDPARLEEAKDLLGHLQGGVWRLYKGHMGEDEVWRKTESERVLANRKERSHPGGRTLTNCRHHNGNARGNKRIPDNIITPSQLKTRMYKERFVAKHRQVRLERYRAGDKRPYLASSLKARAKHIALPLQEGIPDWNGKKVRTQKYLVT